MVFVNFLLHGKQPGAAGGTVETGQMSSFETRQMFNNNTIEVSADKGPGQNHQNVSKFPKQCLHGGVLTAFQETYGGFRGCGRGAWVREVVVKTNTW